MTAALALLASLVWGTSDFVGGIISRRVRPLVVVGIAHAVAFATLVVIAAALRSFSATAGYLPWAFAAGVTGFVGLVAFYRALSTGPMGIVAPIAGTGAALPVIVGVAGGDSPSAWQVAGIVVALAGVILASGPELSSGGVAGGQSTGRRPLLLAVVAAACFGSVYVFIDHGATRSVVMTLLVMRATSVVIASCLALGYLVRVGRPGPTVAGQVPARRDLAVIAAVGWTDAAANGLYALASRHGLVSVVAVLASLYPAVTVVLARVVEDERMRRAQGVGVAFALCGVVLLAAG